MSFIQTEFIQRTECVPVLPSGGNDVSLCLKTGILNKDVEVCVPGSLNYFVLDDIQGRVDTICK